MLGDRCRGVIYIYSFILSSFRAWVGFLYGFDLLGFASSLGQDLCCERLWWRGDKMV